MINAYWKALLAPLAAVLFFLISASSWANSVKVIDLATSPNSQELTGFMQMMPEGKKVYNFTDVQNLNNWVDSSQDKLAAPRQSKTTWLKTTLHNSSEMPLIRWLVIEPWRLNHVEAFFVNPATEQLIRQQTTGLSVPIQSRTVSNGRTIILVELNAGETQQVYIEIDSSNLPFLSIGSWEPIAYSENINKNRLVQTIIFASIVTLLVVLVFQLSTSLFITGIWLLVAFIFEVEKDGFISNYLLTSLAPYSANLRISAWVFTEQLFLATSVFLLGLKAQRFWRWFLVFTAILGLAVSSLSFVLNGTAIRNLGILVTGFYAVSWLFMLIRALKVKRLGHLVLLSLLFIYWAISTFLLLGYAFNFYYTSAFTISRIYIEILIVLALIFTYSWQQKNQLKATEDALKASELEYLETLEKAVASRTEDLNSALESAQKASTAKVNFLGRITHDLRSPLTSILGYSQLQVENTVDSQKANQIIQDSAYYMKNLIDGLVDYARDLTSHNEDQRNIYLIAFIDNLVNQAHIFAAKKNNNFQLKIETELPTVIQCNSTQLQRVLLNLLDNAA